LKAVVVYESHWGNTAEIARAIAEGLGPEAIAMTTDQATGETTRDAGLIVVGAPVIGFSLATDAMRDSIRKNPGGAPSPPELSHPSLRSWLAALPKRPGRFAAFETRIAWSPGGAAGTIAKGLLRAGLTAAADSMRFFVKGKFGPLKDGEVERARRWGAELARASR
jgi:hypothetical protein